MYEDIHWQKYAARYKTFPAQLEPVSVLPGMVVCIPVYAEPDLGLTLESLWVCDLPEAPVEVILFFNKRDQMDGDEIKRHDQAWQECLLWVSLHKPEGLTFRPVYLETLPDPKGGVGWARKLVMDEAARRLGQQGVMLCLDGDCTVERNYLVAVYEYFKEHPSCDAASIYFEHQLDQLEPAVRQAIAEYELHLRYLVYAMRWAGHPFAYQTVGSSMAIRRKAYLAHGGMNTRQAGEDFYFLQKFIEVDSLHEIKSTTVWPSARISYRVPFGTGRAMVQLLAEPTGWLTTSLETFSQIKWLFGEFDHIRQICLQKNKIGLEQHFEQVPEISASLKSYLQSIDFYHECCEIARHTASSSAYRKRFFRYFNAFRMIRYVHYMRDHIYPDVPVTEASDQLAIYLNINDPSLRTTEDYLQLYRRLDKN